MNDLISREAAMKCLEGLDALMRHRAETEDKEFVKVQVGITLASCEIEALPTVEAAPVVHARWIIRPYYDDGDPEGGGEMVCSNCGERAPIHLDEVQYETPHCKDCGAKMDGGEKDG